MENIDLKDRKLMFELDCDARASLAELARKVGLSKEAVHYRIKRLEKMGVIKLYHSAIDLGKMGISSYRLLVRLKGSTPAKKEEIIAFLMKMGRVQGLFEAEGSWDFFVWVVATKPVELYEAWDALMDNYRNYIREVKVSLYNNMFYKPRGCLLDSPEGGQGRQFNTITREVVNVDAKDWAVLKAIAGNARATLRELAMKSKLDARTVSERMRKLERSGVIAGYRMVFDFGFLGVDYYKFHVSLLGTITPEKFKEFRAFLHRHPYTVYAHDSVGGWDLETEMQFSSKQQYMKVVSDIREKFGEYIADMDAFRYTNERKFLFIPVCAPTQSD